MSFLCTEVIWLLGLLLIYYIFDRLIRRPRITRFNDLYILVTGCDTGFGRTTAMRLDALGCHVFAGCLTETGELYMRKVCSDRLHALRLDVSKPESVQQAYEFVQSKLPSGKGLWGLVNNAGVAGRRGRIEWQKVDDYKFVNSVNLYGLIDMTMTFLPLIKKERGRIVNMSSMGGRVALLDGVPYSVSKYAVEGFSDSLRRSLKMFGCTVCIVEPGGFRTNINTPEAIRRCIMASWNDATEESRNEFGEEFREDMIEAIRNIKLDNDPDLVALVYEEALFSRFPRPRYVVGRVGKIAALITPLPEWAADWLLAYFRKGAGVLPAALKKKQQ